MRTTDEASLRRFDSDAVYVNVYDRVFPSSRPDMSEEAKLAEYHSSVTTPKEIKIRDFLRLGERSLEQLKKIWSTEDKKTRSNLKRRFLSAGTISATFYTRDMAVPLADKIKHYNGLIALDFDDVQDVEAAKQKIGALPYVWYAGLSASRRGFFAIIPLDNEDYTRHIYYFLALKKEMADLGFKIDKACSDVTRLRFVSFDPNPIFNEGCTRYCLPEGFDEEEHERERERESSLQENPKLSRALAYANEWEKRKIPLDDYDDWRTMAMALTSLGEQGWEILEKVSQFGKNYDQTDNKKKFEEFRKHTRSIGLGSFFYKCQEYGVIPPNIPHYDMIPFPVEVFPSQVQTIIKETHRCLNFTVDHIAASLLFVASVAVGNSVIVEIKNEWLDKAILYIAIVGKPGTNKSAPLKYAFKPLVDRDKKSLQKYEKQRAAYELEMQKPLKERKAAPIEPEYEQIVLSDFTTEVLVRQHKINARSLAVYVDELIGFIKNFNKYRSGNDEQVWTQLYNGGSVIVNRVSSQPLNIEDTCIGVIGTIQPGLLFEFAKGKTESGFVDRWLFAYPDDSEYPKLNNDQLPKELTKTWCEIIDKIYKIPFKPSNKTIKLSKDALQIYTQWFNALADQKNASSAAVAEMLTKMERYCIRFSIVLEALKYATTNKTFKTISAQSIKGGIDLCYYFTACGLKARKKFNLNPIDELNEKQKKIYLELPISFTTAEGIEVASQLDMSERTFKEWLKSNYFRHISHGQYEKRYK